MPFTILVEAISLDRNEDCSHECLATTWETANGHGTMSQYRRGDQPIPYEETIWAYHCWVGPFGHEVWENEKGNLEYTIFWPTDEPWVEWVKLELQ